MKDNSKKTNKQNTARSSQNTARKLSRKTKDERREILFSKKHAKMEHRRAVYSADGGAEYALARGTDLNRRFIAAFMALVFALTTMVIGVNITTRAESENADLRPAGIDGELDPASKMVVNKYLTANSNGKYDLTLEAYSTSEVQEITEKVPTDFVIVVDQSGSMDTKDMPTGDPTVQNNKYLEDIANGQYYYKDSDNNYYRVYGSHLKDISKNNLAEDLADAAENGEACFYIYVDPKLNFNIAYDQLFSDQLFLFKNYIYEANSILGYDTLAASVSVAQRKWLRTIMVELNYN